MSVFLSCVLFSIYHTVWSRMHGDANHKTEFKVTIY